MLFDLQLIIFLLKLKLNFIEGPILFLIYVNDIPEVVKPTKRLFADDTKIYRELTNPNDTTILQSDLDSLDR